jgi:hypothetical protein
MVDFNNRPGLNKILEAQKAKKVKLKGWIDAVNQTGRGLTDWEEHFMESLTEQWADYETMSPKQEEVLEKIYAEKTPL